MVMKTGAINYKATVDEVYDDDVFIDGKDQLQWLESSMNLADP